MGQTLTPTDLYDLLLGKNELALIDVREQGDFGRGHILRASNLPLSRFELDFRCLIPRPNAPVVLVDDDAGPLALSALQTLSFAGWSDIRVLEGGLAAWIKAGFSVFTGLNVPSKAFGEYVEARYGTPHLSAQTLKQMLARNDNVAILDSRPFDEFKAMAIPGGIDMPGAELVHRVRETVSDPQATIVVNCAGRTRSIIGAQSLINAKIENPVYALENGTMGWMLAGENCAPGLADMAVAPGSEALKWSQKSARDVGDRFGVHRVDAETLRLWQADEDRTTFIIDVRTRDEFDQGHWPGSRHVAGGQLVQETDDHIGVLNARIVLTDDTETRALMTASWLRQMGWENVAILAGGLGKEGLRSSAQEPEVCEIDLLTIPTIDAETAIGMEAAPLIDFSPSLSYRKFHPKGARFAIRSRAFQDLRAHLSAPLMIFTADDVRVAELAAHDLSRKGCHRIRVLAGGNQAWERAGGQMESGFETPLSKPDDVYHRPYEFENDLKAMQRYLDWEVGLMPKVEADGTLRFPEFDE